MKVGFSGTRRGMTERQKDVFYDLVCSLPGIDEFHHGDCVGADDDAVDIIHEIMMSGDPGQPIKIVAHPGPVAAMRANNPHSDETRKPLPFLDRNRNIVDETGILIACPGEVEEIVRSGTWSAIRHAKKTGKRLYIIYPNGVTSERMGRQS